VYYIDVVVDCENVLCIVSSCDVIGLMSECRFGVKPSDQRIMAVVGAAGVGKSALLAKVASDAVAVSTHVYRSTVYNTLVVCVKLQ